MDRHLYHVDAFTRTPGRGNGAGVVLDTAGLTDADMLRIAADLGYSEAAFVFPPSGPDHDVHVRFFSPTVEVPVCGHATVSAHYVRAVVQGIAGTFVQKTGAGPQRITVEQEDGDWRVRIRQGMPTFGEPLPQALRERIARALGVAHAALADLPVQVVSTGHSKVMVPLADGGLLDKLAPDMAALAAMSPEAGSNGYFVFAIGDGRTDGRMFAPAIGIDEDPVTGNANGPAGAYLVRHRLMPHDGQVLRYAGHQGRAMGRDGVVHVAVEIDDGAPVAVTIAGDAVITRTGHV